MKHRGVICDKCDVEVTLSKVRRERLGHIELASPCSHVWFFKGLPSRIGYLLDISMRDLERILYFEAFVVVDAGEVPGIKERELLPEEKYRELMTEYAGRFRAVMGAEAIKELLRRVEVEKLSDELREKMKTDASLQKRIKFAKRLKVLEAFRKSGNKPEWMILDVIPVLPPYKLASKEAHPAPSVVDVAGVGSVESWEEVIAVDGPLITFRSTTAFLCDDLVLESISTLRFRSRSEIEDSLVAEGFELVEIRDAPDRPGREFVFLSRRPR